MNWVGFARRQNVVALASLAPSLITLFLVAADEPTLPETAVSEENLFAAAFAASHNGYSSDELLCDTELQNSYFTALEQRGLQIDNDDARREVLLQILKLRKAGKLDVATSRRGQPADDSYLVVAEIAVRVVTDRHQVATDTVLADPRLKKEFVVESQKLRSDPDEYQLAKAVLRLRKIRRLQPELVLRVADWKRQIETMTIDELRNRLDNAEIASSPGVYIFRDVSGYLYIGEAKNLADRLIEHVRGSDREQLANYLKGRASGDVSIELHIFPRGTPADQVSVRRAYESELIRSREPKLNVRP